MTKNRATLSHRFTYAWRHPGKIQPYLRRLSRDLLLRLRTRGDHLAYYRAVMKSDTARDPERAVGGRTHERWLALGRMQFDYLLGHGLRRDARVLEIGCGNLRAGHLLIDYLDPGHYTGLDISPDILRAAEQVLDTYDLHGKKPTLLQVSDNKFAGLPDEAFDVVHAHSVYSHCPIEVIEECFAHVGRVMAPAAFFDLTFDRTEGTEHQVLREDFYYRTETLAGLAAAHGLTATFMDDWERLPHGQSKLRLRKTAAPA